MFTVNSPAFSTSSEASSHRDATPTQIRVLRILSSLLPMSDASREIPLDLRLSDLGIGSFTLIGLVVQLEDEFGLDELALGQIHGGLRIDELWMVCHRSLERALRAADPEVTQ
jgi:hypothetical protein